MSTIMLLGGWNEMVPCIALCAPLATRVEAYAEARGYAISALLKFVVACATTIGQILGFFLRYMVRADNRKKF